MNCSHNNMTQLPLKFLPDTEQLVMDGNNLDNLWKIRADFRDMKIIDLKQSNIHQISVEAFKVLCSKAKMLKLSGNNIKQLPSFLRTTNNETQLWLSNNPYECNCDMMWMSDWLQNATNVMDRDSITCGTGKWNGKLSKIK